VEKKESAEKAVREIRRKTRRRFSAEEKIRIVLEGLRGDDPAPSNEAGVNVRIPAGLREARCGRSDTRRSRSSRSSRTRRW
jgi:transposase-like protein